MDDPYVDNMILVHAGHLVCITNWDLHQGAVSLNYW